MYNGIAVYNKRVAYAEQLPKLLSKLAALQFLKGQLFIWNPSKLRFQEIDENSYYGSGSYERSFIAPAERSWNQQSCWNLEQCWTSSYLRWLRWWKLVKWLLNCRKIEAPSQLVKLWSLLWMELWRFDRFCFTVLVGNQPTKWSGSRHSSFPWFKLPFAEVYEVFKNTEKFIQVDIDPYKLGKTSCPWRFNPWWRRPEQPSYPW